MNRIFDEDDDIGDPLERSGRVRFDDRGNAVWEPVQRERSKRPILSLAEDEHTPQGEVKRNATGLKKGYDPYESGFLKGGRKEAFRKRKDLRALSEWIQAKKLKDERGDD
jgi:hypothetical protein